MVTSYVMEPAEQMCNCFKRQAQGTAWSMVSYSEESGFLESGRLDNSYWLRHHQLVRAGRAVQLVWEGPAVWRKYASSPEKGDLHHPAWKISCSFCIIIKKKKLSTVSGRENICRGKFILNHFPAENSTCFCAPGSVGIGRLEKLWS